MRIIEPNVELVTKTGLEKIELIGKVCTKMEHTIKEGSAEKFCHNRLGEGHTAIFMHNYVYFDLTNVEREICRSLALQSPFIKWDRSGNICAINYRTFIDILFVDNINPTSFDENIEEVSDLVYVMFDKCPEFRNLFYSNDDFVDNITFGKANKYYTSVVKVDEDFIKCNYPEILAVTFKITTDRGITHELVRHTTSSFMQESTRWCNYNNDRFDSSINVIVPPFKYQESLEDWSDVTVSIEEIYKDMINRGETPQIARSILNNSTKADIYVTSILREWIGFEVTFVTNNVTINENKGFLPLRTAKNAHPQMIPIAKQIGKIIHDEFGKFIDVKEEYYE